MVAFFFSISCASGVRKGTKNRLGYEGVRNCIKCYVSRQSKSRLNSNGNYIFTKGVAGAIFYK